MQILTLSDTEKGYEEKESLPIQSLLNISALFDVFKYYSFFIGGGNKISKNSVEDGKKHPQSLKGYYFLPGSCCCIKTLQHWSLQGRHHVAEVAFYSLDTAFKVSLPEFSIHSVRLKYTKAKHGTFSRISCQVCQNSSLHAGGKSRSPKLCADPVTTNPL